VQPTSALLAPDIQEIIRRGRYAELRSSLTNFPPVDLADLIAALEPPDAAVAFRFLPRPLAAATFSYLDPDHQESLIGALGRDAAVGIVEAMSPDDRAELLDELPSQVAQRIIAGLSPDSRRVTQAILGYPPESVGRIMTPGYVRVRPSWTVEKALTHLRRWGHDAETVNWVFVIDEESRLIGDVGIRYLLLAEPDQTIDSVMDTSAISLRAADDQEEAVRLMARYDRTAIPVVDAENHLIGIVTFDDVADIAEFEVTEDIHKQAGMEALGEPYMQTSVMGMVWKRGPWLGGLFIAGSLTVLVLDYFKAQLDAAVVIALFIPLIIASGGNSATQAATLVTRALALQEVSAGDWFKIIRREVLSGVLLGGSLALLSVIVVFAYNSLGFADFANPTRLAFAIAAAVAAVVLWGALLGSLLPIGLDRLGADPAASSSPLVATMMDVSGMLIYMIVVGLLLTTTPPL